MTQTLAGIEAFARETVRSSALSRDAACSFDRDLWRELGKLGVFGLATDLDAIDEEKSPSNLECLVSALECFSRGGLDIPLAVSVGAQLIAIDLVATYGSHEQRQRYLPGLIDGSLTAAICNSEAGAGTDLKGMRSSLETSGGDTGAAHIWKMGATNAGNADLMLCSLWHRRLSEAPVLEVILIEKAEARQECLVEELSAFRTGLTGSVRVENVTINLSQRRLGTSGCGFHLLKRCFNLERLLLGTVLAGALEGLLSDAMTLLQKRDAKVPNFSRNQYIQGKMIDLFVAHKKLKTLVESALSRRTGVRGLAELTDTLSVLKLATVTDASVALASFYELFGFPGLTNASIAQKAMRDHMALRFLGGSQEQQKMLLFAELASRFDPDATSHS